GWRFSIRYCPVASVRAVRTFSMSAGLAASTVTPGRTAPDASLTVPTMDPWAYRVVGAITTHANNTKRFANVLITGLRMETLQPFRLNDPNDPNDDFRRRTYGAEAGVGPAATSVWLLGSSTVNIRPTGAPFFTGSSVTVTASPGLNARRAKPRDSIVTGFCVSTAQFRMVPVSSFASNFRKQCGLAQIHSVTTPLSVISLPVSNVAAPWCATTDAGTISPAPASTTPSHTFLTGASLSHVPPGLLRLTRYHVPVQLRLRRRGNQ